MPYDDLIRDLDRLSYEMPRRYRFRTAVPCGLAQRSPVLPPIKMNPAVRAKIVWCLGTATILMDMPQIRDFHHR